MASGRCCSGCLWCLEQHRCSAAQPAGPQQLPRCHALYVSVADDMHEDTVPDTLMALASC